MSEKEIRTFDAEVGKVLQLMIHSLYTNKDIFLRELISNASDACDKLRYLAITQPELLAEDSALKVTIAFDEKAHTLRITDNGVGMNRDDLITHLGTIARSGTEAFLKQLTGDDKKDMQLIGQFGVGFYSSFMVAEEVTVITRKAGEAESWKWQSQGDGQFTVEALEEEAPRGTSVILTIRENEKDYLDKFRLRHIVTTYSDHISIPIELLEEEGRTTVLNSSSALWMRPKSEVTEEQYEEFYRHVAHASDAPWMTLHNRNEGTIEFTNLLYIPSHKPFDLFHPDRKSRLKLYVRRVFITDEGVELIPAWLRFLRGVVDSEDLPLNISRETLQHNHVVEKIKKSIVKRVLGELKKKAEAEPEAYVTFWENFGAAFKEGLCEGGPDRESLLEVCRFASTSQEGLVSIDSYLERMKPGQESIYYMTGDDIDRLRHSPQLEGFTKRGIEVLLLTDTVDDFWVNVVHEYKGKAIQSITRAGIELDKIAELPKDAEDESTSTKKADDKTLDTLIAYMKTTLGEQVADVRLSKKLADSPVCLAIPEGAMDMRMERFLIDQKQLMSRSAKILEINQNHPIILTLAENVLSEGGSTYAEDMVRVLFDQACIIEGEPIYDPSAFSKRLNQFLSKAIAA